jgi:phenylalanyl-tRNA synthetase alpha chain
MLDYLKEIFEKAKKEIGEIEDSQDLEDLKRRYLGRKGLLAEVFNKLGEITCEEERRNIGKFANEIKEKILILISEKTSSFRIAEEREYLDISLPGIFRQTGRLHILTQTMDRIISIFQNFGFKKIEGPEIETEFNNFTALNIPLEHPSRDVFDTFYIKEAGKQEAGSRKERLLLRSHTSPVQVRVMRSKRPPLAVVTSGRVYRPDAVDASHSFMFHQIEGFLVDREVRFSDLKGILSLFAKEFFEEDIKFRFRPHYFPFTEPSAEMDISCIICKGRGCSVCSKKGWLEILGCGMIHPFVFRCVGYSPKIWRGFAFGIGIERMAMLKFGINDIRIFFENDLRFLRQF